MLVAVPVLAVAVGLASAAEPCQTQGPRSVSVRIDEPAAGERVSGVLVVRGRASSVVGVQQVELWADDALVSSADGGGENAYDYALRWDAAGADPGPVTLRVVACGRALQSWGEASVTVTVAPAATPAPDPTTPAPTAPPPGPPADPPPPQPAPGPGVAPQPTPPDELDEPPDATPEATPEVAPPAGSVRPERADPTPTPPAQLEVARSAPEPSRPLWPVAVAGASALIGVSGALVIGRYR